MVWRTAERKVVGSVSIGEEGLLPPPFIPTAFFEDHKKIKRVIDHKGYYSYQCVTPSEIAEEVGLSEGVVKEHIDVLELDEAAVPMQKGENPAVCSVQGLDRLVKKLRELRVSEFK